MARTATATDDEENKIQLPLPYKGKLKGVHSVETIRVRKRNGGGIVIINQDDFDSALHRRLKKARPRVELPEEEAVPVSRLSRTDMAGMSIKALKQLPEWSKVRSREEKTDKDSIISAILAARKKILSA